MRYADMLRDIGKGIVYIAYLFAAGLALWALHGCTTQPPKQVVQYQTVEVPKYIRAPIPAQYLNDCTVNEPAPACGKLYCNGQVAVLVDDYRSALKQCNADKAALRSLQPTEDGK